MMVVVEAEHVLQPPEHVEQHEDGKDEDNNHEEMIGGGCLAVGASKARVRRLECGFGLGHLLFL